MSVSPTLSRLPLIFRRPSGNEDATVRQDEGTLGTSIPKVLLDLRAQVERGLPISAESSTFSAVLDFIRHTEGIDDRKLLLEHVLTFLSRHPDSDISLALQTKVVELLYNDLSHPPATVIGNKYAWRTADGSYNNISLPTMGQAGQPYARSVQQSHPLPRNSLPDPGLIFDTLLKRDKFVKHPAGLSSLMFSFAALVIHSVFRTSHRDVNINETSSYVDLSPLYGNNQAAQDKVRVRDGRGLLHPDVFAEDRLLFLPPAVCVLLVLFNRNHNYIARKLLEINERGTYVDPATLSSQDPQKTEKLLAQEEEIFQTTRLINASWFASVVFSDYFSCILGLVREGSSWSLNPFEEIRNLDHSVFERGQGNVCSVEFNCLYRWHATTSVSDEAWIAKSISNIFDGKDPEKLTPAEFKVAARKIQAMDPDVTHWTFGGFQRQADGTFRDDDLAKCLHEMTDEPAGAFRARGTPSVMRLHEIMGIEQNRQWGVCSLNEFRKYLGLKAYTSFKEWNPDPQVADVAEKLYGHIDNLELYVGLQAEEVKPVVDGAGLCPGYTISRAILSDAIALTRGDRFFTTDYTPFNMTAWGFADCQRDPNGSGFGSTLGRLFLRTLPNNYEPNSVYTWFPLMTPEAMKSNLTRLNVLEKYSFSSPSAHSSTRAVSDYAEVARILRSPQEFISPSAARAATVIKGSGFFTASTELERGVKEQREVLSALTSAGNSLDNIGLTFYNTTRDLINANSYRLIGSKTVAVDIVRDVFNYVPLYWAASEIAGIQLKTKQSPHGTYTAQELHAMLGEIYSFIFLEVDPSKYMVLQEKVKSHIDNLLTHIKANLTDARKNPLAELVQSFSRLFIKAKDCGIHNSTARLRALGYSSDSLANSVLALLVGSTVELSLALTNMIDLYLDATSQTNLQSLATSPGSKDDLGSYVDEALRLAPSFQGVYRVPAASNGSASRIFLDIATANVDVSVFPEPLDVVLTRKPNARLDGDGSVSCLGETLTRKIMSEVLRAVFSFANVRRGPGQSGTLNRFRDKTTPLLRYGYLDSKQIVTPWPTSLVIQYDEIHANGT